MPIGWVISKVKIGIKLEKISNKIFLMHFYIKEATYKDVISRLFID